MEKQVFEFEGKPLVVSSFVDPTDGRRYYAGKAFAEALGYSNTKGTIKNNVRIENVKSLADFASTITYDKSEYHQDTKFLSAEGLLDLIKYSKKSNKTSMDDFLRSVLFKKYKYTPNTEATVLKWRKFIFDSDQYFTVGSLNDAIGRLWFTAVSFASILNYSNLNDAINTKVDSENRTFLREILQGGNLVEEVTTRDNDPRQNRSLLSLPPPSEVMDLRPQSVFINRAGIFQLIRGSKMPKAKLFTSWIDNDVLPKLCGSGEYNVRQDAPSEAAQQMQAIREVTLQAEEKPSQSSTTNDNASSLVPGSSSFAEMCSFLQKQAEQQAMAVYNEKFAAAQREHEQAIARYDEKLASVQREHEQAITRYDEKLAQKEKQHEKEIATLQVQHDLQHQVLVSDYQKIIARLESDLRFALPNLGLQTLLNQDNTAENNQMRETLRAVSGRVIPDMSSQPEKRNVLAAYKTTDKLFAKIVRGQRCYVDSIDDACKGIRGGSERPLSKKKAALWLGCEKFADFDDSNSVKIWLFIRRNYPHCIFGLKFFNTHCTLIGPLSKKALTTKYREMKKKCESGSAKCTNLVAKFQKLKIKDEEDLIERCYTAQADFYDKLKRLMEEAHESLEKEVAVNEESARPENAWKRYKPSDITNVLNTLNLGVNYGTIVIQQPNNQINNQPN